MKRLPVIDSCDGCGACCMSQGGPPMYVAPWLLVGEEAEWCATAPQDAKDAIDTYIKALDENPAVQDSPCCWFDIDNRRCRFYEHRPSICREFEMGSEACHDWRKEFPR